MRPRKRRELQDANDAGTEKSPECTLILPVDNATKTLTAAGLGVVGHDAFGVLPLSDQLLNHISSNAKPCHTQMLSNGAIKIFIRAVGLEHRKKYSTTNDLQTLRYGKLLIMTNHNQYGARIIGIYNISIIKKNEKNTKYIENISNFYCQVC